MNGVCRERGREERRDRDSTKRPRRSGSHINNNKVGHLIGFCAAFGDAGELYLTPTPPLPPSPCLATLLAINQFFKNDTGKWKK